MMTPEAGAAAAVADSFVQIIHRERKWLDISERGPAVTPRPPIVASRWVGRATEPCEQVSEIPANGHVIGIALQPMEDVTVFGGRKLIQAGFSPGGSVRLYQPGLSMRGIFRGAYDELHLHIPNEIVAECAGSECRQFRNISTIAERPMVDPVIERLARSLIHADDLSGVFGQSYAEGIGLAIAAQLFGGDANGASANRPRVAGLSKWRLKRATEYIAANLAEPMSLANIAAAAGLSRMHFAAQFRVATGLRPHEFLLRRRIERAQSLLLNSRMPLVEIAFEAGFKTQAHFTTVFARLAGETPNVWRQRGDGVTPMPMLKAA